MGLLKFVEYKALDTWSVKEYVFISKIQSNYKLYKLKHVLNNLTSKRKIKIDDNIEYKEPTISSKTNIISIRKKGKGKDFKVKNRIKILPNDLVISKMHTQNGLYAFSNDVFTSTNSFMPFNFDNKLILKDYLSIILKPILATLYKDDSTNRETYKIDEILNLNIPLPPLEKQQEIVNEYEKLVTLAQKQEERAQKLEDSIEEYITSELGIEKQKAKEDDGKLLKLVEYKDMSSWGVDNADDKLKSSYKIVLINDCYNSVFRGKSPKYDDDSKSFILNQKCNRWNNIDLSYIKNVSDHWFNQIEKDFLTREGDILINSTGEGTIGRASHVFKFNEGLLYDSHMLNLRLNKDIVEPKFFVEYFNSIYGQGEVNKIKSAQSTKQTELGVNNLKKINFILPPLQKQKEIAEHIEKLKDEIKTLRESSTVNRELAISNFESEVFSSGN